MFYTPITIPINELSDEPGLHTYSGVRYYVGYIPSSVFRRNFSDVVFDIPGFRTITIPRWWEIPEDYTGEIKIIAIERDYKIPENITGSSIAEHRRSIGVCRTYAKSYIEFLKRYEKIKHQIIGFEDLEPKPFKIANYANNFLPSFAEKLLQNPEVDHTDLVLKEYAKTKSNYYEWKDTLERNIDENESKLRSLDAEFRFLTDNPTEGNHKKIASNCAKFNKLTRTLETERRHYAELCSRDTD